MGGLNNMFLNQNRDVLTGQQREQAQRAQVRNREREDIESGWY